MAADILQFLSDWNSACARQHNFAAMLVGGRALRVESVTLTGVNGRGAEFNDGAGYRTFTGWEGAL